MNATKILWGAVLIVSAVVLAFLWGATEWVAWSLARLIQPYRVAVSGVALSVGVRGAFS
jgi:hypothetical protein